MNVFIHIKALQKDPFGGEIAHLFNSAEGKWLVFTVLDYRLYHLPLKTGAQRVGDATALDKGCCLSAAVPIISIHFYT